MKHVLALSLDPARVRSPSVLVASARRAFALVHGDAPTGHLAGETEHVFASGIDDDDHWDVARNQSTVFLSKGCFTTSGRRVDAKAFVTDGPETSTPDLRLLAPPFGAVVLAGRDAAVEAFTDTRGLRHVFYDSGDGWAAVASDSAILAVLGSRRPRTSSIGSLALLGFHLGDDTSFDSIVRLPPGTACRLRAGRLSVSRYVDEGRPSPDESGNVAGDGAATLSERLTACLDAYSDVTVELSGGLDSRAVLSAVPPERRKGLHAVTLGSDDTEDVRVARVIAARWSLDHQVIDLEPLRAMDPSEARARVEQSAAAADTSLAPVANAAISWAESQIEQRPRLTGQGGEFAWGFYYPGYWNHVGRRSTRAAGLARWRLFMVEVVDADLFVPDAWHTIRSETTSRVQRIFGDLGQDWLTATDEFYLLQRMRNWAGSRYSAAGLDRRILAPFFHPEFVAWARGVRRRDKSGSRAMARTIQRLDGELAEIRLEHGESPAAIAKGGAWVGVRQAGRFVEKGVRKVRHRLERTGNAPNVGATLAELVVQSWSEDPESLRGLEAFDVLDHDRIQRIASGEQRASPASIGFLVNLDIISRVRGGSAAMPGAVEDA